MSDDPGVRTSIVQGQQAFTYTSCSVGDLNF